MFMLEKIFNHPIASTPDKASVTEVREGRDAVMNWLDQRKIDVNNIIKLYIAERTADSPRRLVIRMDAQNSYREREMCVFDGQFDTLHAAFEDIAGVDTGFSRGLEKRLKRTIEAMGFVELELADGRCVGFNPRKFTVLERAAGCVDSYLYSHVADERGFVTAVKGGPGAVQDSFDRHKTLMASAEEYAELRRQERRHVMPERHSNPYLKF